MCKRKWYDTETAGLLAFCGLAVGAVFVVVSLFLFGYVVIAPMFK